MEKINATAKSMNFTNGISWARNAFEKKLSQLEYNNYEKCHFLRNLIAHGSACDIQISEDTMQIATAFYAAITAKHIETPKLADGSTPVQSRSILGKSLYVIEKPKCSKQDGKHYITFQYVQYDPQEKESQVQEMTCEGYKAGANTFVWPNEVYDTEGKRPLREN